MIGAGFSPLSFLSSVMALAKIKNYKNIPLVHYV